MSDFTLHRILHYEDEPDQVDWLPGLLFEEYCELIPELGDKETETWITGSETVSSIDFVPAGLPHRIEYRLIQEKAEFLEAVDDARGSDYLVILDIAHEMPDVGLRPEGIDIYRELEKRKVLEHRIFFLTAYPGFLKNKHVVLPVEQIFIKPPSLNELTRRVLSFVAIPGLSGKFR